MLLRSRQYLSPPLPTSPHVPSPTPALSLTQTHPYINTFSHADKQIHTCAHTGEHTQRTNTKARALTNCYSIGFFQSLQHNDAFTYKSSKVDIKKKVWVTVGGGWAGRLSNHWCRGATYFLLATFPCLLHILGRSHPRLPVILGILANVLLLPPFCLLTYIT